MVGWSGAADDRAAPRGRVVASCADRDACRGAVGGRCPDHDAGRWRRGREAARSRCTSTSGVVRAVTRHQAPSYNPLMVTLRRSRMLPIALVAAFGLLAAPARADGTSRWI